MALLATLRLPALGLCTLLFASAPQAQAQVTALPCVDAALGIPQRPALARGASEFIAAVAGLNENERDRAIRTELLSGNMPGSLRRLLPLGLSVRGADGRLLGLTLCVLPDYLGLGSDDDHLLVPLVLETAFTVASRFGLTLPTRRSST